MSKHTTTEESVEQVEEQAVENNFDRKLTVFPTSPEQFAKLEHYLKKGNYNFKIRGGKFDQLMKSPEEEAAEEEYRSLTSNFRFRMRTAAPKNENGQVLLDDKGNPMLSEADMVEQGIKTRTQVIKERIREIRKADKTVASHEENGNNK